MPEARNNKPPEPCDKLFDQYVRLTADPEQMKMVNALEDAGIKCLIQLHNNKCVGCGAKIQAIDSACGEQKPEPGDILICNKCGNCMFFNEDMSLSYAPPSFKQKIEPGVLPIFEKSTGIEVVFRGVEK